MARTSASCLQRKVQGEGVVIWNTQLRPATYVSNGAYRAIMTTQRRRLEGAIGSALNGPPKVHAAACISPVHCSDRNEPGPCNIERQKFAVRFPIVNLTSTPFGCVFTCCWNEQSKDDST